MNECNWTEKPYPDDDSVWEAGCGETFALSNGTPADNHYIFCPRRGRPIKQFPIQYLNPQQDEWQRGE